MLTYIYYFRLASAYFVEIENILLDAHFRMQQTDYFLATRENEEGMGITSCCSE